MTSFFLTGALDQVKTSPTMKLHDLIDWQAIEQKLVGLYKREASGAGGPRAVSAAVDVQTRFAGPVAPEVSPHLSCWQQQEFRVVDGIGRPAR